MNETATTAASPVTDTATSSAVSVDGLAKRYGEVEAVRGIDFEVASGETFGFLGPNGAGKSTTINMLCTLVAPERRHARGWPGTTWSRERDEVRRNIGLVFQDTTLDGYLTAEQNLRLHAELYGVPREPMVGTRMRQVLEMVGLWERRDDLVQHLLRRHEAAPGDRARPAALAARAVPRRAHRRPGPADAQLDLGLHPRAASAREDITIFLTTHYMDEAEYCDRIAIIDHGRIVVLDTPEALKASVGKDRVQIQTADDQAAIAALRERFGIEARMAEGAVTFGVPEGEQFVPRLFAELGVADPLGERRAPVARRRLHVLHRHARSATPRRPSTDRMRNAARMMGR